MILQANENIIINAVRDVNHTVYTLATNSTFDLSIYDSETIESIINQLTSDYGASSFTVLTEIGGDEIEDPINATVINLLPFHASANRSDGLINQTTTLQDYISLTFVAPSAGSYRLDWHYLWSYNSTSSDFRAEVQLDSTVLLDHREEPQDSGGSGQSLPTTSGGSANSGTDQKRQESGFCVEDNLAAGEHTFKIQFRGSSNNQEATIYQAHLAVTRVK
jgi:hypothetical protein